MDIRGQEVLELRRRDGNDDNNNTTTTTNNSNNTNNNNDNKNDNNNNFNGNASVSCTTQTLDHHTSYVPLRTLAKSPPSAAAGSTARTVVRYRECLKNHAASVGGSVHDGCGEFMPSGEEGTIEALKCAACDCHRNFHRKEVQGGSGGRGDPISHRQHHQYYGRRPPPPAGVMNMMLNPLQLPPPGGFPPHHHHHQKYGRLSPPPTGMVTPMSVAYGGGSGVGGAESSSEELNLYGQSSGDCHGGVVHPPPSGLPQPPFSLSKKRYRTKFTSEQKERMTEFAEKLGWRMNKQDEEELERFCAEIGVKRQVFKVWMHNNKNNVKKQQPV